MTAPSDGMTVIEVVITLAILSILMTMGVMNFRPPAERLAANAVQSFIQQGRFDAIKTNRPVVISFDSQAGEFAMARMADSTTTGCASAGAPTRRLNLAEYRGVASQDTFSVLWLPTGQPRACPTGAAPLDISQGAAIVLTGSRTAMTVAVGAGGEVVVQ